MSTIKNILDMDLRKILNPKFWLLVVLISHTIVGTLVPLLTTDFDSVEFQAASYGLVISVVLASIYFMTEGQTQARLTATIAGATLVWILVTLVANPANNFDLSVNFEPPFLYKFSFDIELAPPIIVWAMLTLSGITYWNCETKSAVKETNLEDNAN
tara:strand:- start:309 stop:779 length:471 start_codon:yes stop_codon:yes gene_type:complete